MCYEINTIRTHQQCTLSAIKIEKSALKLFWPKRENSILTADVCRLEAKENAVKRALHGVLTFKNWTFLMATAAAAAGAGIHVAFLGDAAEFKRLADVLGNGLLYFLHAFLRIKETARL